MSKDYFDVKNEQFFDFLEETFKINKARNWDEIARGITVFKIKRTYRVFAELFPRKVDYRSELFKSRNDFTSIHFGSIKASRIIDEVTKFSLYSDKIIVFHPLQNPAITNQQLDPGRNPLKWLPDFLDALYFYIVIQKWVKAGIVKLIINPYAYDLELRNAIEKKTLERVNALDQEEMFDLSKPETLRNIADAFTYGFRNSSQEEIYSHLMKMEQPKFGSDDANEMAKAIIDQISYRNPLYDKLTVNQAAGVIMPTKGGGPLESILLVAEQTGGTIYTPSQMNWAQIQKMGLNDFWMKANHVYSNIDMNFLSNVDTDFALNLRKDDRLAGVRKQLKKIYSELNSLNATDLNDVKIKELEGTLRDEVKVAEAEWKEIKRQADINRKHWIATNASLAIPLISTNKLSIIPMLATSAAWLYKNEASRAEKETLQRAKNPISVFVDLKNKPQSFITNLRNCVM